MRALLLCPQGGTSKPAAGGKPAAASGGGISNAGGVGVGLEEEIKKLQRAQKFKKLDEKDEKKLEGLLKKLEAQKQKQQLALDRVSCKGSAWGRGMACVARSGVGAGAKPEAAAGGRLSSCAQLCWNAQVRTQGQQQKRLLRLDWVGCKRCAQGDGALCCLA